MNDIDVAQAVEEAGSAIEPTFRRDLRAVIQAELAGELSISGPQIHRLSSVRKRLWIGLAAVGVAAAAVVAAVFVNIDDRPTVLVPTTDAAHETEPADTVAVGGLIERLSASRWVLSESSGAAVFVSAQAFIDFVPTSDGYVAQFDRCDQYSIADRGGGVLAIEAQVFNCPDGTATWGVSPPDELVLSEDGSRLDLVAPDEATPRYAYVRLDSLGPLADDKSLVGEWSVGDTDPVAVDFAADGTLTIAGCTLHWHLTDSLSVTGDGGAPATCAAAEPDEATRWLVEMFGRGPVEARVDPTTARLHLSGERSVMQLVSASAAVADAAVLLARLGESQWMLDSIGGQPFDGALVPWVSFESSLVGGYDGCNQYQLRGSLDGDIVRVIDGESTAVECPDAPDDVWPFDGDRIVMSQDSTSFDLVDAGGTARLGFTRFDHLGRPPSIDSVRGRWQLGDREGTVVEFADDGTVSTGGCTWTYGMDQQMLVPQMTTTLASGPGTSCLAADAERTLAALIETFDRNSFLARLSDDGTRLYLMYDVAIQLRAVPPVLDPAGITFSAGAAFGLTPGTSVTSDQAKETVEAQLGPLDFDTGWYPVQLVTRGDGTVDDCLGGREYRVLWWGDLSMAFWRTTDGETFWTWTIGDKQASMWGDRDEPYTPVDPVPTGLTVDGGIGIGSTEDAVRVAFADRLFLIDPNGDGSATYDSGKPDPWQFPPGANIRATIRTVNGVVTGIGVSLRLC